MNSTMKDIHYLMAQLYLCLDGIGADAFAEPKFTALAEKYGFFCNDVDDAIKIIEQSS